MSTLGIDQTPADAARQEAVSKKANTIFILSLVSILFCCVGGIAASIVANRAKNDVQVGNIDSAESQINIAMILMIVSFVIGALSILGRLSQFR
jgi:hypothetical protein